MRPAATTVADTWPHAPLPPQFWSYVFNGHLGVGVYDRPHFDFHFQFLDEEAWCVGRPATHACRTRVCVPTHPHAQSSKHAPCVVPRPPSLADARTALQLLSSARPSGVRLPLCTH